MIARSQNIDMACLVLHTKFFNQREQQFKSTTEREDGGLVSYCFCLNYRLILQ